MSQAEIALVTFASLIGMIFLRVPVAVALILVAFGGYGATDGLAKAFQAFSTVPYQIGTEYTLSVIPLFIFMGAVASRIGLSARLFNGTSAIFGRMPGSGAMATIGASAAFGAICGSSLATTATIGRIAIPELRRMGYRDSLISGSIAAGGALDILIPPSIILVIYGIITEQSIERLFAGALVPGLVLTVLYLIVIQVVLRLSPAQAPNGLTLHWKDRLARAMQMWEVALLFGVSIGGLYAGLFTPTEAASVGAFLALAIGIARRVLRLSEIQSAVMETVINAATLFFVVLGATFFSYFVIQIRLPSLLIDWVSTLGLSPTSVILIIIAFYIVGGFLLEGIGLVLATVPVFFPLVHALGFDPIWFGIIVVVVVEIGLIHPPMGMNLFVIKSQAPDMDLKDIYTGTLPFLLVQGLLIALLVAIPQIVLWFPSVIYR
jgi:C4-dicarboxylate transporter, DctM subunit